MPTARSSFFLFPRRHDFSAPELIPLLDLDQQGFSDRFRNSPIKRAKLEGLQRNVCVALGNIGDRGSAPALVKALGNGTALVRMHAAWALGRLGGEDVDTALREALMREDDDEVLEEIRLAIEMPVAAARN